MSESAPCSPWTCTDCQTENPSSHEQCAACGLRRTESAKIQTRKAKPQSSAEVQKSEFTLIELLAILAVWWVFSSFNFVVVIVLGLLFLLGTVPGFVGPALRIFGFRERVWMGEPRPQEATSRVMAELSLMELLTLMVLLALAGICFSVRVEVGVFYAFVTIPTLVGMAIRIDRCRKRRSILSPQEKFATLVVSMLVSSVILVALRMVLM